jgi:hypothetical protein
MVLGLWVLAAASLLSAVVCVPLVVREFQTMVFHQRLYQAMRGVDRDNGAGLAAVIRAIPRPTADLSMTRAILIAGALGFGASQAGLLVLTSDEKRYPDKLSNFRVGARVICGFAGLAIILMFLQMLHPTPWGFPEWMTRLTATAGGMLTWGYLHRIARRMPHKALSRASAWMTVVPLISLAYTFIRHSDWLPDVIPVLYLAASAGLFVWFALVLRRTARLADGNWAAETATQ